MISAMLSRLVILVFGTLYPAYASFKAVKNKNVKEYVKWMMYWIVFAFFTCTETLTDLLLSFWFPFYYEIKIILVIWLLSPATKGSSILYRKFVHPQLTKREKEIDEYIARSTEQGYHTVLQLGRGGLNFASQFLMQTAMRSGGSLVDQLRRSCSLSDLATELPESTNNKKRASTISEVPAEVIQNEFNYLRDAVDGDPIFTEDSEPEDGPTLSSGYSSASAVSGSKSTSSNTAISKRRSTRQAAAVVPENERSRVRKSKSPEITDGYATLPRATKKTRKRVIKATKEDPVF